MENQLQHVTDLSEQKKKSQVFVLLFSESNTDSTLELSYMINNASWHPVYDVRADLTSRTASASIELVTAALVEQHTGENWDHVQLTVSTLDPLPLYLPKLKRWTFSEKRIEAPAKMAAFGKGSEGTGGAAPSMPTPDMAMDAAPSPVQAMSPPEAPKAIAAKEEKVAKRDEAEYDSLDQAKDFKGAKAKKAYRQNAANSISDGAMRNDKSMSNTGTVFGALKSNGPADKIGANGTRRSAPSSNNYELQSLESFFPSLVQIKQSVANIQSDIPKSESYEITEQPTAPAKNNYTDSNLPAMTARGRNIEFVSPFNVTINSDDAPQKIPFGSQVLKAELNYFAIPKKSSKVYLRAKTLNSSNVPLLGGPAQIFMNGDLISKTTLSSISEGGTFSFDLGSDSNIEVKRVVDRKSDDSGFFKKSHHNDYKIKIEVANHHAFPVKVELKDNFPQSPNSDIQIEFKSRKPSSIKDNQGLLVWQLAIPPKSKQDVLFDYGITYPANFIITEED